MRILISLFLSSVIGQGGQQILTNVIIPDTEKKVEYATKLLDPESDEYKNFVSDRVLSKLESSFYDKYEADTARIRELQSQLDELNDRLDNIDANRPTLRLKYSKFKNRVLNKITEFETRWLDIMAREKLDQNQTEMDPIEFESRFGPVRTHLDSDAIDTWLDSALSDIKQRFANVSTFENVENRLESTEEQIKLLQNLQIANSTIMDDKVSDEDFQKHMNQVKSWGDAIKEQEKVFENMVKSDFSTFDHSMVQDAEKAVADLTNDWTAGSIKSKIAEWAGQLTLYVSNKHVEYKSEYDQLCQNAAEEIDEILKPISNATLIDIETEISKFAEFSKSVNETREVITGHLTDLETVHNKTSTELTEKLKNFVTTHEVNEYEKTIPEISDYLTKELFDEKVAEVETLLATFAQADWDGEFEADLQNTIKGQHEAVSVAAASLESKIADWQDEINRKIDVNSQNIIEYTNAHGEYDRDLTARIEEIEAAELRLISAANKTFVGVFDSLKKQLDEKVAHWEGQFDKYYGPISIYFSEKSESFSMSISTAVDEFAAEVDKLQNDLDSRFNAAKTKSDSYISDKETYLQAEIAKYYSGEFADFDESLNSLNETINESAMTAEVTALVDRYTILSGQIEAAILELDGPLPNATKIQEDLDIWKLEIDEETQQKVEKSLMSEVDFSIAEEYIADFETVIEITNRVSTVMMTVNATVEDIKTKMAATEAGLEELATTEQYLELLYLIETLENLMAEAEAIAERTDHLEFQGLLEARLSDITEAFESMEKLLPLVDNLVSDPKPYIEKLRVAEEYILHHKLPTYYKLKNHLDHFQENCYFGELPAWNTPEGFSPKNLTFLDQAKEEIEAFVKDWKTIQSNMENIDLDLYVTLEYFRAEINLLNLDNYVSDISPYKAQDISGIANYQDSQQIKSILEGLPTSAQMKEFMSETEYNKILAKSSTTNLTELFDYLENMRTSLNTLIEQKATKSSDHADYMDKARNLKSGITHCVKSENIETLRKQLERIQEHDDFINDFNLPEALKVFVTADDLADFDSEFSTYKNKMDGLTKRAQDKLAALSGVSITEELKTIEALEAGLNNEHCITILENDFYSNSDTIADKVKWIHDELELNTTKFVDVPELEILTENLKKKTWYTERVSS